MTVHHPAPPSIDTAKLLAADNVAIADRIWEVAYEIKLPAELITDEDLKCPDCDVVVDIEDARTLTDTITILGGSDAQVSVDKVREYLYDQELEGGLYLTDFVLTGVNLLATAEVL